MTALTTSSRFMHTLRSRISPRALSSVNYWYPRLMTTTATRPSALSSSRHQCPRSLRPRTLHDASLRTSLQKRHQSSTSPAAATLHDPERPDLYYHLFEPPHALSHSHPVFALSFLDEPPVDVLSPTVIGWLPVLSEGSQGLNDFTENAAFVELLQEAVRSGLKDDVDDIQRNGAIQTQEGWMHIHDERNPPPLGRIGDPDDIIGSVRIEGGKVMADTYQAMPSYRVCTSDGVLRLTEGLANRLKELLEREAKAERS
ncbi:unnamed protein product [Somion occarium]|uniref:Uncharacterized protein n=1 Tax=Somion occarium TaxID=3059160 RepID=A0ABP1DSG1_9APHY